MLKNMSDPFIRQPYRTPKTTRMIFMALLGHATRTGLAEVVVQGTVGAGYLGTDHLESAC
jgi:hypothetical protein